jgi:hypothetical protein
MAKNLPDKWRARNGNESRQANDKTIATMLKPVLNSQSKIHNDNFWLVRGS